MTAGSLEPPSSPSLEELNRAIQRVKPRYRIFCHPDEVEHVQTLILGSDLTWMVLSVQGSAFVEEGTVLVTLHEMERVRVAARLGVTHDHPARPS